MSQSTCKQLNAIVATDMVLSASTSTLQFKSIRPFYLRFTNEQPWAIVCLPINY